MSKIAVCSVCGETKKIRGKSMCSKCYEQTPERKAHRKAYCQTPEFQAHKKAYRKAYHKTPEFKAYEKALEDTSCIVCGLPANLVGTYWIIASHRITPGLQGGKYIKGNTAGLCCNCHKIIHQLILQNKDNPDYYTRDGIIKSVREVYNKAKVFIFVKKENSNDQLS